MSKFIREIVISSEISDAIAIVSMTNSLETLRQVCIQLEIHQTSFYWL